MGRLWGSWRGYDIDQFEYKILAFVSGKDVDIAAARVWVAPVDLPQYTNVYSGTQ